MNEQLEIFKKHPAYQYAYDVANEKIPANIYILKVCQDFIEELDKSESKYYFDFDLVEGITQILDCIIVPSGFKAGHSAKEVLAGFQWFFIINALCWKMSDDHEKRRYEKSIMLIARKSGKTFITALLFIILLLLEPDYSNFFSVAPTLELSTLIFNEVTNQLHNSPLLANMFRITNKYILCLLNNNKFTPLATGKQTMDGRLANVFVVDEVGALRDSYPISAMESSQMNIKNRTGILISTAYPTLNNPMTEQVEMVEKSIEGKKVRDDVFGLIYKPDFPAEWKDNDVEMLKANPLAVDSEDSLKILKKKREDAIEMEGERSNFLTKHMNIFINGAIDDTFVTTEEMNGVPVPEGTIDWNGKKVYVGLDLSQSGDNTAVAITNYDKDSGILLAKTWIFYPEDKEADKTKTEGLDYARATDNGYSIPSGNMTIDYNQIENFVLDLERDYGVDIYGIGYDRWGANATAQRLGKEYDVFEINQKDAGAYLPAKFLKEKILEGNFHFEDNFLLMSNFLNAKKQVSSEMSYHLNKKTSEGKIDAVAAIVDSVALWLKEIDEDAEGEPFIGVI